MAHEQSFLTAVMAHEEAEWRDDAFTGVGVPLPANGGCNWRVQEDALFTDLASPNLEYSGLLSLPPLEPAIRAGAPVEQARPLSGCHSLRPQAPQQPACNVYSGCSSGDHVRALGVHSSPEPGSSVTTGEPLAGCVRHEQLPREAVEARMAFAARRKLGASKTKVAGGPLNGKVEKPASAQSQSQALLSVLRQAVLCLQEENAELRQSVNKQAAEMNVLREMLGSQLSSRQPVQKLHSRVPASLRASRSAGWCASCLKPYRHDGAPSCACTGFHQL